MEFKKVPVHLSLTRQQLMMGCDRELFFMLLLLSGLLCFTGFIAAYWRNLFIGIVLWIIGTPVLSKLAKYDPHFRGVLTRSTNYMKTVVLANGKPGLPPKAHNRWS